MNFKKDLSSELTIFVIAVEKQENYKTCLRALNEQTVKFKVEKIEDVYPMSKAFNLMFEKCKTSYFIQLDEDMILNQDAVEIMYDTIIKSNSDIVTQIFHLIDAHSNKIIRGVRINKTEILKNYPFQNTIASESNQTERMKKDGYIVKRDVRIVGLHSPYWNCNSIFKRYYNMMERSKQFGGYQDVPYELWEILKKAPTKLNLYALLGAFSSLFNKKIDMKEKNYKTSYNKQLTLVNNYFDREEIINPNSLEFISIDRIHPYIKKLKDYLNIEFVNNLTELKESKKPIIIWNSASHVKLPRHSWKQKLMNYCREKNRIIYNVERGALPNTIFLDYNGFLYDSASYNSNRWNFSLNEKEKKEITKYINDFISNEDTLEKQNNNFVTKSQFNQELNISSDVTKVFVPLQVKDDTVVLLWSDWVISMNNFKQIIEHISKTMNNVIFLVKNHPVEVEKMLESDNIRIVDNYHYKDCIKYSDVVLTINSGIGLQSMMWKKPVIITGNAFYQHDSINRKANNIMEIKNLILNPKKPNWKSVRRFIHYLRFKFYTECNMKMMNRGSSLLENVTKLRFYTPEGRVNINTNEELKIKNCFVSSKSEIIFTNLLQNLNNENIDFHLLNESCLDSVRYKKLVIYPTVLHIGTKNVNDIAQMLETKDWVFDENSWNKENCKIYLSYSSRNTKEGKLFSSSIKIPLPVLPYLTNLYGADWKNYKK